MKQYTSEWGWKHIETLQKMVLEKIVFSLNSIISSELRKTKYNVIDFACGTSLISHALLKDDRDLLRYTAVDTDGFALEIAKKRWAADSSLAEEKINIKIDDVKTIEVKNCDMLFCLSNTFLSFGTIEEIKNLLRKIGRESPHAILIISVLPWTDNIKNYYQQLTSWQIVDFERPDFRVKVISKERHGKITQTVTFRSLENGRLRQSKTTHSFLCLTPSGITDLFSQAGWKITGWFDSLNSGLKNPEVDSPKEYFIVCKINEGDNG